MRPRITWCAEQDLPESAPPVSWRAAATVGWAGCACRRGRSPGT